MPGTKGFWRYDKNEVRAVLDRRINSAQPIVRVTDMGPIEPRWFSDLNEHLAEL